MPRVATYGDRKVQTAALPGVRKTAAETDISTGAGLEFARAEKWGAIAHVGQEVAAVGLELTREQIDTRNKEIERADQVKGWEIDNNFSSLEDRLLIGENGAFTKKGKEALGTPETTLEAFDKEASTILQGATTTRQREDASHILMKRRSDLEGKLHQHVFTQMQAYEADVVQARIVNKKNEAAAAFESSLSSADGSRRVHNSLQQAEDMITVAGPRLGQSPEEVQKQIEALRTATHAAVIQQLLAQKQTTKAQVYFDEVKTHITTGDVKASIEKALQVTDVQTRARKAADAILADGGTLTEQLTKARSITDLAGDDPRAQAEATDVREAVERQIEHAADIRKATEAKRKDDLLNVAYLHVDQQKDPDTLPPSTIAELATHMPQLREAYARRIRGEPKVTDDATYFTLRQKAIEEMQGTSPGAFTKLRLIDYRHKLDDGDYERLLNIRDGILTAKPEKVDAALGGFRSNTQILRRTFEESYGIDIDTIAKGSDQYKALSWLEREVSHRLDEMQGPNEKGKRVPATDEQIQATIDNILSTKRTGKGGFWDWYQPTMKRAVDITIKEVPPGDRLVIERSLQKRGITPSDAMILDYYVRGQIRSEQQPLSTPAPAKP